CGITVSNISGPFVTYSQGEWGSTPHGANAGALLSIDFAAAFPGGSVSIGYGSNTLTFTSPVAIQNFLPQGGPAAALSAGAANPANSSAGNLAGQLLAATLSYSFSQAGLTRSGLDVLKAQSGPLAGSTVAQILNIANHAIAGDFSLMPAGLTM